MALSLIAVGVLLLLRAFIPSLNLLEILRFSPLILIFLGVEILLFNIFQKEGKLRYDVLSVFLCLILIGGSFVAALIPEAIKYSHGYSLSSGQYSHTLEEKVYDLLAGEEDVTDAQVYLQWDNWTASPENITLENLPAGTYFSVDVRLSGTYNTKEEFAAACHRILGKLQALPDAERRFGFSNYNTARTNLSPSYTLDINGKFQENWTKTQMAENTHVEYWTTESGGYYMDEEDYLYRQANPEEFGAAGEPVESTPASVASSLPDAASAA